MLLAQQFLFPLINLVLIIILTMGIGKRDDRYHLLRDLNSPVLLIDEHLLDGDLYLTKEEKSFMEFSMIQKGLIFLR